MLTVLRKSTSLRIRLTIGVRSVLRCESALVGVIK